jgi:hypothetical protein
MVTTTKGIGGIYPLMIPLKTHPKGMATIHPFEALRKALILSDVALSL